MSYFGRNIKKIRTAKNISQTAFADLFKLTRASIGAYEEGRAEAKIDTIIEIAEHFKLSLDQLLKKELTLNEIYHISEINKKLDLQGNTISDEIEIPLVSKNKLADFIKKYDNHTFLQSLDKLKFPGLRKESVAFEFGNSLQYNSISGFSEGDILIAQKVSQTNKDLLEKNQMYVVLTVNSLFISHLNTSEDKMVLFSDDQEITKNKMECEPKQIWQVYRIFGIKITVSDQLEKRLQSIENQLKLLLQEKNSKML